MQEHFVLEFISDFEYYREVNRSLRAAGYVVAVHSTTPINVADWSITSNTKAMLRRIEVETA